MRPLKRGKRKEKDNKILLGSQFLDIPIYIYIYLDIHYISRDTLYIYIYTHIG